MKSENQIMLLREAETEPTEEVLENALGKEVFSVYKELMKIFIDELGMEPQWRFYKDGNAWLCKVVFRKKTILWLSVWEKFIKTGFYFSEKTRLGIFDLEIKEEIKETFSKAKTIGKLIPLALEIEREEQIEDLMEIIKYKKKLK